MEMLPQQPDDHARSLFALPDGDAQGAGTTTHLDQAPRLRLVGGRGLTLAHPVPDDAPAGWQAAIESLAQWLDLDLVQVPQRPESGLRRVTAWAASAASVPAAASTAPPVFAPWRCWSPISLQQPDKVAMPRASWVGSYLYDYGVGKPLHRGPVDIQLLSPLPDALIPGHGNDAQVPRPSVLQAMLRAAQREGRDKIAIITDAHRRNAMIRQLLHVDRSITRDKAQIDVLSIENALCELVQGRSRWDAIIVLPDLRSVVFAMLAQMHGSKNAWPMVWHNRDVAMICAETLDETAGGLSFSAPLAIQALALAADHAGLTLVAGRLIQGAVRIWDCNIVTPGHGSVAPYVTEISDQDFIDQLCRGVAGGQRSTARWRAIAPCAVSPAPRQPARLSVVGQG